MPCGGDFRKKLKFFYERWYHISKIVYTFAVETY